ncbi:MAG: hypothetical protein AAGD25_20040 [Cyanobacteria bacterium P01_F01_bin.150]
MEVTAQQHPPPSESSEWRFRGVCDRCLILEKFADRPVLLGQMPSANARR